MSDISDELEERLVKSAERVRDLGEVFTPAATVKDMLDLLPKKMWAVHPSPTFLEPACGDGNFLVAILDRKLTAVAKAHAANKLPAGQDEDGLAFHALQALSSIYAIDISADNIIGGTPGHEIGARQRLLDLVTAWHHDTTGVKLNARSVTLSVARWIVERNVIVGNMLDTNADGTPSGRDDIQIVEYDWQPDHKTVAVSVTTLGAVMAEANVETTGRATLFDDFSPAPVWSGNFTELRKAPVKEPALPDIEARNGRRTA